MEICTDAFLINIIGNLLCTLRIKNREDVKAVYGIVSFKKIFLYTPGTGVDTEHRLFGFHAEYDPDLLSPTFPPGVTVTGLFKPLTPNIGGNLTEPREGEFSGAVVIDRDTYPGDQDMRYAKSVIVRLKFNPGINP